MVRRMKNGKAGGFAYIALLTMIAVMGIMMMRVSGAGAAAKQREQEAQLLFAGDQILKAIDSYYRGGPHAGCYPMNLESLVEDKRLRVTARHLRRLYADPMSGKPQWGVIRDALGNIKGVYSPSERVPMKQKGFAKEYKSFSGASSLSGWKFVHHPQSPPSGQAGQCPRAPIAIGGENPGGSGKNGNLSTD